MQNIELTSPNPCRKTTADLPHVLLAADVDMADTEYLRHEVAIAAEKRSGLIDIIKD